MRFLPVNLNAMLVELDNLEQTLALLASLQDTPISGIEELVPAARTILINWRPSACNMSSLIRDISQRDISNRIVSSGALIDIPVHYNGEDLAEVAQLMNITPEEVILRHTGSEYRVAFTGFAPGFAYLSGGHPSFNLPRRSTPRTRIPAGAVGLAGTFSAVYPKASPGGWQIIGVTPEVMWDVAREMPALLQPGDRVRFVDIATLSASSREALKIMPESKNTQASTSSNIVSDSDAAIEVLSTGLQTLFQDLGRAGLAGQGVSASGAMDQSSLKTANRLVGNASNTVCLETVGGGLRLRSRSDTVIAITGAETTISIKSAEGREWHAERYQAIALADGDSISLTSPQAGCRSYIAVRGGFTVTPILGSCSTDTLAHVGPAPLRAGDVIGVGKALQSLAVNLPELPPTDLPNTQDVVKLDVILGPRTDWFTTESVERLSTQLWQVTPQSNRIGLRLNGELALEREITNELPSEGTTWGALQVPAAGQPVLFLADHPLTGGYPVIGSVATYHLDRAAQIPINAWVQFNIISDFKPITTVAGDTDSTAKH